MHYYKRNIGDYAKKAGRLSILQHGVYNLLIDACYDREKFPTREEALDWVWASTPEEEQALDFVLRKFFTLEDGVYVQSRIAEEIAEYQEFCREQAEKGKKGGRPKKPVGKEEKPAGFSEEPNGKPQESSRGQEKTLTTNHYPLTTNHQPSESDAGAPPAPAPEKPKRFVKPSADEVFDYMVSKGMHPSMAADQSDRFINYYESNGWKVGKNSMKNWRACVNNQWMKPKFEKGQGPPAKPQAGLRDRTLVDDLTDRSWAIAK